MNISGKGCIISRMKKKLPAFLYNLTLALLVGGTSIFTFIVTPAIFRSFDRDTAGRIVGALFDGYFSYNLLLSFVLLGALSWRGVAGRRLPLILIVAAIAINAAVCFKVYPDIKEVKRQVSSFETMPKDSDIRREFSKLHAINAILNLALLADGVTLIYLGTGGRKDG